MWASVFFAGIRQFFNNLFSDKNKAPFWRGVYAVLTVCVLSFTCMFGYSFYMSEYARKLICMEKQRISTHLDFVKPENDSKKGWIRNIITGEIITRDIDWVAVPMDEDSLMVFSRNGKRGYINRFSGEIAISAQYAKAWIFSNGIAGVCDGEQVYFIDHAGKPVSDMRFAFNAKNKGYVFHGELCAITEPDGKMGLIDRHGRWVVEPEYEWICPEIRNYWKVRKGDSETGLWYALNDKGKYVDTLGAKEIEITEDLGVVYTLPNHKKMVVGFDGSHMDDFICKEIEALYYNTEEMDSTGTLVPARCTLYRYRMDDGYEGLCKENGEQVTEPLYWEIYPITKDIYHCKFKESGNGVVINSKGEVTRSKY